MFEAAIHLGIRVLVGAIASGLLAFGGYIMSNLFVPPAHGDEYGLINIRLLFVALGAGVGSLAGWTIRDENRPPMWLATVFALVGGFLGAWIGMWFAEGTNDFYDIWTRHLQITQATVLSAAVGANVLVLAFASVFIWLKRES
jgi:hypothetical protein